MIEYIKVKDFNPSTLSFEALPKRKGFEKKNITYAKNICAFDIETTNIDKIRQAVMYIWQFQIDDITIIGRKWNEFVDLIDTISEKLGDMKLVIFVHNLSFEFQWLKSQFKFEKVFAMDNRKILKATYQNIEFRCSYLHSNMSLEKFIQSVGGTYEKQHGFDYSKKRYYWTKLSEEELKYCIYDVKGLVDAIKKEMEKDGDDLYSYPLTSTGYVRREFREELAPIKRYVQNILPSLDVFLALRQAFRGGNTHANRWNANRLLENVTSYDISSSYPAVMLTEKFPQKFIEVEAEQFDHFIRRGKACLFHVYLEDVKLKDEAFGFPYLAKAKCENIRNGIYDNGRILECDSLDCWINEIDFQILESEYTFQYDVMKLYIADKKPLPKQFKRLLFAMYQKKTELKGIDDYFYSKFKNKVNSTFGMTVQNPCKPEYILKDGILEIDESKSFEDLYNQYLLHGWLPYQWGCWITSYARLRLEKGLHAIPYEAAVYVDTDSIKFLGDYASEFEKLNEELRNDFYFAVDKNGKKHYVGIYELDGRYKKFKTLGAKKYCYTDEEGLHVTIAGVNKKAGAKELGKIENFQNGFTFYEAGGTESIYNDDPPMKEVIIQNHKIEICSNIAIYPSMYTLGMTQEYESLLNFLCESDIRLSLHYDF